MNTSDAPPSANITPRHSRNASHPLARRFAKILAGLLVLALVVTGFVIWRLQNNITTIDIGGLTGRPDRAQPANDNRPVNVLIMGSDSREGSGNKGYGKFDGARSDTTLLVHIAGDRQSATVVSIPRDSMVEFPGCPEGAQGSGSSTSSPTTSTGADGQATTVMRRQMFNEAFNIGGPTCTLAQVEHNTDIFVDHFAVVDFAGFKSMVDALGGVPVCVPQAIRDEDSNLDLPAGDSVLNGEQSLAFVRTRKAVGDGSDLGRIKLQQAFLASMVREATSSQLLLRPDKLVRFLDAATKSLATDPDLGGVTRMTDLASQVKNISPKNIRFVTIPVETYPQNPNRVQWTAAAADVWSAIREDRPLTPGASPSPSSTVPVADLVDPSEVRVRIINRSGISGLARQASEALAAQGFSMAAPGSGAVAGAHSGVRVTYPEGLSREASTVAAAFPGAVVEVDYQATGSAVTVELGKNTPNVVLVPTASDSVTLPPQPVSGSPSSSETLGGQNAEEDTLCG